WKRPPRRSLTVRRRRFRTRPVCSASGWRSTPRCSTSNSTLPRRTQLPNTANIDQHKSLAFVEAEEQVPPEEQFIATWEPDGRRVTVSGQCPACHGRTSTEFTSGIVGAKGSRGP